MRDPMWEPTSDYDDQMTAVEDGLVEYDDVHCEHGTFIGGWAGPDYLCGWCETGVSLAEYEAILAARDRRQRRVEALSQKLGELLDRAWVVSLDPDPQAAERLGARIGKLARWGVSLPVGWRAKA